MRHSIFIMYPIGQPVELINDDGVEIRIVEGYEIYNARELLILDDGTKVDVRSLERMKKERKRANEET